MRTIPRILLATAALLAIGVTLALGFDESGVDFTDQGIATAYVTLDHGAGGLVVSLTATAGAGVVGTLDVEDLLPDVDDDDVPGLYGSRPWAGKAFAEVVAISHASDWYSSISLTHNQAVGTVADAYLRRLAALGYSLAAEPLNNNISVYTATRGGETIRLVIVRKGGSTTTVTLSPS